MLHRKRAINKMFRRISPGLIIAIGLFSLLSQGYTEEPEGRESTEQWEEIALIRQQIAVDLDLQAESKRTEAIKLESTRSYETAGDALDNAGDDKYSASDNYQKASKYWRKIAEAYKTEGEDIRGKKAQDIGDTTWEAAKRTLREGAKLHKTAAELFEIVNNPDKKISALKKVARNLESLLNMK